MSSKELRSNREMLYFVLSIIFSLLLYILTVTSLFDIAIFLIIGVVLLFANAIILGSIRGNGIRISEKQFPDVYDRVVNLSTQMGIKKVPDVFVIHSEGVLNAFATRFFGRNMVVIYSEVFELARQHGDAELDFIIAHELSHVKRRHVWKSILIMPAQFIPFLSQAYSRSCEYTCDTEAAYYIQNGVAAKQALTILGVGKKLYKEVNEDAYLEQINTESNVAVWLSEVLSSHPLLPKRIQAVGKFMQVEGTPKYYSNPTKISLGIGGLLGIFFTVAIVVTVLFTAGTSANANFFSERILDEVLTRYSFLSTDTSQTPLMEAVSDADEKKVKELIGSGVNLEEQDSEKTTALLWAVYNNDDSIVELLLDAGANPNTFDDYSNALTAALYNENYNIASLLYEHSADPSILDSEGDSGFNMLDVDNEEDFLSSLQNYKKKIPSPL